MYETEANSRIEQLEQISTDAVLAFSELEKKILARTVLPWSEHCTECAWPTCYKTCDLYTPREDGRCRRFIDGMVRIDYPEAINGYLLKIRFKQWGKLWAPGNLNLKTLQQARQIERRDYQVGSTLYHLATPKPIQKFIVNKRYSFKKRQAIKLAGDQILPTAFLLECYSPTKQAMSLSLTCRSLKEGAKIPFQKLLHLVPGYQLIRIPFEEISSIINFDFPFGIELIPNIIEGETTLYFGLMELVRENPVLSKKDKTIKCVVWDLDNTLWDGVLVEDGSEKLQLKPRIIDVIETLDKRGILQSIASKNDFEQAMKVLKQFQIDHFFLYPQISWSPKGEAVRAIAQQLNISQETLLFVDDSPFERHEVESSSPEVRMLDAVDYISLLDMEECQVPITEESKDRRRMYQVESNRKILATNFRDDYKDFLKSCNIRLTIDSLGDQNLERVHELAQRTNQMNFSGNRYTRGLLREILQTPYLNTYVLTCEDKFGSYGIVGFSVVDVREPRMTDLMFSCRIQSKRIEHAFLSHIIRNYINITKKDFYANYRKTSRNKPSGEVFSDFGMQELQVVEGVTSLVFRASQEVSDDGIISIVTPSEPF